MNGIILGDCVGVMRDFPENSIDCVVTDPPYGLNFMGKAWDKALPPKAAFIEMCRVLKPGALAFVMSSPRQDLMWRMAQLLEESGFELGQSFISRVYASGFPKAYDIPLGIDSKFIRDEFLAKNGRQPTRKELNNLLKEKRKVVDKRITPNHKNAITMNIAKDIQNGGYELQGEYDVTEPASSKAKQWSGWKSVTGLKPALEVVFMVQKPLSEKTIVDNVLRWGTGAVNVDACRIPIGSTDNSAHYGGLHETPVGYSGGFSEGFRTEEKTGRFPANLLVSGDALNDGKPQNKGHTPKHNSSDKATVYGKYNEIEREETYFEDAGSFSRYFDLDAWARHHGFLNVAKAGTGEREHGLSGEKNTPKSKFNLNNGQLERFDGAQVRKRVNTHPTVKPIKLMAYLIELGCPKDGVVLDPFVGSGSTCIAAKQLGRKWIGVEVNPEYVELARARVGAVEPRLTEYALNTSILRN